MIQIDVNIGDTILTGKFKNKKTVIKKIGKDDHGMPTINGRKVATFRIHKKLNIFDDGDYDKPKQEGRIKLKQIIREEVLTEGSSPSIRTYTGKKSVVQKKVEKYITDTKREYKGEDREAQTHSGDWNQLDKVIMYDKIFDTENEAEKFVLDHAEVWYSAAGVQFKKANQWLIGAWLKGSAIK